MIAASIGIFILLCSLGIWQLHRADEKKQWIRNTQQHLQKRPLSLDAMMDKDKAALNYHPVTLKGGYDLNHIIFLDNKIYQHQVGYQVLVPFIPDMGTRWVWVNRGWIPRGRSRDHLPEVILPKGQRLLTGLVHVPEKGGVLLGENLEKMRRRLWRAQALQIKTFNQVLNQDFYPFEVLLLSDAGGDSEVGVLDWKPSVAVEPARHIAYAVQWFGLAGVFLVVFLLVHVQQKHTKGSRKNL